VPFIANGKTFKVGLYDTGIISEILKNKNDERLRVTHYIINEDIIPSISIWSILEIRRRRELYSTFLKVFSAIPFFLLRDPFHLLQDEIHYYPDPKKIKPVEYTFSPIAKNRKTRLKPTLDRLFSMPENKKSERLWNSSWKRDSLDEMLSLEDNFEPTGKYFNSQDAKRFVKLGLPNYILAHDPDFITKIYKRNVKLDVNAFPSTKMSFYTVFYRFYAEDRDPEEQDVFDILIGNIAPYIDVVFTEKFQAEIYRKVSNFDPFLDHLTIRTIDAFR
jgi:hypothetical protein